MVGLLCFINVYSALIYSSDDLLHFIHLLLRITQVTCIGDSAYLNYTSL